MNSNHLKRIKSDMKSLFFMIVSVMISSLSYSQSYAVEWGKLHNAESIDGDLYSIKNGKTSAVAKATLKGSSDTTETSSDGFVQYVIEDFNVIRHIGFTTVTDNGQIENNLKYSFHLIKGNKLKVVHARKMLGIHNINIGDTVRIERLSGVMYYYINNQLLNNEAVNPEENLAISVNMFGRNAEMTGIRTDIRIEPLHILITVDNTNNSFDYTISGGTEQGYELKIENTDEVFQGAQGSYSAERKGTIGLNITDSDSSQIFREVTIGEDINWTDFNKTIVSNGSLIVTEDSLALDRLGSANSQQVININEDWVAEYIIKFDEQSKSWGVLGSTSSRFTGYLANFYISDRSSQEVSYFFNGNVITSFTAREGDILRLEVESGVISAFYNGELIRSISHDFQENYQITAMLRPQASFDQITFLSNFQKPIESFYDSEINRGQIEINVPDGFNGPFHYLIGTEDFIDLNLLFTTVRDSIGYPIDSTFLEAKEASSNFSFDDLRPGVYFISVLDSSNRTILKETVIINQEFLLADNTSLHKEGNLFIAEEDNTFADFPLFISKEASQKSYAVQLFDVIEEQYFGFGLDTVVMTSKEDIRYGYYVSKGQAFPIIDGEISDNGFWILEKSILELAFDKGRIDYSVNSKQIYTDSINFQALGDTKLNLKHGLSKAQLIFNPIIVNLVLFPFHDFDINVTPILCTEELSSVEIDFNISGGYFYTPVYSIYNVTASDGTIVGNVIPNSTVTIEDLPPGLYEISGTIHFNPNFFLFPPIVQNITEYFVVGYPIDWVNKIDTEYDDTDESLTRIGNTLVNPLGYASTNNNIIESGSSWVDFKIKDDVGFSTDWYIFEWSSSPLSQYTTNGTLLFVTYGSSLTIIAQGNYYPISSYFSESDRLRIEYDSDFITISRNGADITSFPASSTDFKRLNAFILNLDNAIYDVYSNMNCEKTPIYAKVERKLRGVRYKPLNKKVYFYYGEEYLDSDGGLNYRVMDENRNEAINNSSQNLVNIYGDNRCSVDISSLAAGSYILEVQNDKKERFYLRFLID